MMRHQSYAQRGLDYLERAILSLLAFHPGYCFSQAEIGRLLGVPDVSPVNSAIVHGMVYHLSEKGLIEACEGNSSKGWRIPES